VRCLGVQLYGKHVDVNEHGEPINGDSLLILFNGDQKIDIPFELPPFDGISNWQRLLDSADPKADESQFPIGTKYPLRSCSVAILRALTSEAQAIPVKPAEMMPATPMGTPADRPAGVTATDVQSATPQSGREQSGS
jgi:hypothetical protein